MTETPETPDTGDAPATESRQKDDGAKRPPSKSAPEELGPDNIDPQGPARSEGKPRLIRLADYVIAVRSLTVTALFVVLLCGLVIAVALELNSNPVLIEPIGVPGDLNRQGYTPTLMAARLQSEIHAIQRRAATRKERLDILPFEEQQDIEVPGTGITILLVVQSVRGLLDFQETRIQGDVVQQDDGQLSMFLRITGTAQSTGMIRVVASASEAAVPGKTPSETKVKALLQQAAQEVIRVANPYVLASYYNSLNRIEEAEEVITQILNSPPADDDLWAHNLQGFIYEKQGRYKETVHLYRLAAEQGHAIAQSNLGVMYERGNGVEQDFAEAIRLFRLAAKQGEALGQNNLGYMYDQGKGVEQNLDEALRLYRLAAKQGEALAQINLGKMYHNGRGVELDLDEAVRLYRLAAEQGHPQGQINLGKMYHNGRGVELDLNEAVRLYHLAAEQGHPQGQINLGLMYQFGVGVERNPEEARRLFSLAAEQGNIKAQEALERLPQ